MKNKIIKVTSIIASSVFCYNLLSSPSKTKAKALRNVKRTLNSQLIPTIALTTISTMSIIGIAINAQRIENDRRNKNETTNSPEKPQYGFLESK